MAKSMQIVNLNGYSQLSWLNLTKLLNSLHPSSHAKMAADSLSGAKSGGLAGGRLIGVQIDLEDEAFVDSASGKSTPISGRARMESFD